MKNIKDYLKLAAFVAACVGIPQVLLVGIPLWKKSQEAAKECEAGKPTPPNGCTVTLKP